MYMQQSQNQQRMNQRSVVNPMPNLINIMGPFASALTGGSNGPPPRGHPNGNEFQPPEKRVRR